MWALLLHLGLDCCWPVCWSPLWLADCQAQPPHLVYCCTGPGRSKQNKNHNQNKQKKSLYNNSKINNRAKNNKYGKRNRIVKEKKNMRRLKKRKMIMRVEKEEKQ